MQSNKQTDKQKRQEWQWGREWVECNRVIFISIHIFFPNSRDKNRQQCGPLAISLAQLCTVNFPSLLSLPPYTFFARNPSPPSSLRIPPPTLAPLLFLLGAPMCLCDHFNGVFSVVCCCCCCFLCFCLLLRLSFFSFLF